MFSKFLRRISVAVIGVIFLLGAFSGMSLCAKAQSPGTGELEVFQIEQVRAEMPQIQVYVRGVNANEAFVKCTSPITQRSLSSGRGTLIGLVGSLAGQTIELKPGQRIKIGRSAAEASVIVNSEKISRVHCLVQYNGNQLGYTVTDLSRNGVVVNGKRILYSVPTYVPSESVLFLADGANKFQLT